MAYKTTIGNRHTGDLVGRDDSDKDTKIDFEEDQIKLIADGNEYIAIGTGSVNVAVSGVVGVNGGSSGYSGLTVLENGRVGIGTDAPDYKLDVAGNVGVNQYIYHNGDANTFINFTDNRIRLNAGGSNFIDCEEDTAPHNVRINNGGNNIDFVIKDNSGNVYFTADASTTRVGIGTDTPSTTLDVSGDVNFDGAAVFNESSADKDFRVESNNAENMFFINGAANRIGIGTNSPQHTLDIQERAGIEACIRLVGTTDVGIRLAADSDNSGENDNPYIDFYQDGQNSNSRAQRLATLAMEGDAGATFTDSLANTIFLHAANPATIGQSNLRTLQLANDSKDNGNAARITLEGNNGFVGIHTNAPSTEMEIIGTTKSDFFATDVTEQDLGSGTSSTLATGSGIVLLDADSINGIDMGLGIEVHNLTFPTPSVSGQRLTIIAKNANTNNTMILPSGLISGSFSQLHDSSGISVLSFVWVTVGTGATAHAAWYQTDQV